MAISHVSETTLQFLNESNRIEGITEIDYRDPSFQDPSKGHFGAYALSQQAARDHQPLSHKMIRAWQALLGREQKDSTGTDIGEDEIGHFRSPSLPKNVRIGKHVPPDFKFVPLHVQTFLEDLNKDLAANHENYGRDDEAFARFAGSYFLRFERIHPFADGNGRVGRLIANYLATYCGRSILIFPSDFSMRSRYIEAHDSDEAMIAFFAKRMTNSTDLKTKYVDDELQQSDTKRPKQVKEQTIEKPLSEQGRDSSKDE